MDKLVLANIQALAASVDNGGSGSLEPASAALGLSAALFLSNLDLWQGASYSLTESEIDDIQAMIAQLENDLINAGDVSMVEKVKLSRTTDQVIPSGIATNMIWDDEIYNPDDMFHTGIDNNSIYAETSGFHMVDLSIVWANSPVGARELRLWHYDTTIPDWVLIDRDNRIATVAVAEIYLRISTQLMMTETDRLVATATQSSAGDLSVLASAYAPLFAAVRI